MSVRAFYDALAPWYHLVYQDWEASITRQGEALRTLGDGVGPRVFRRSRRRHWNRDSSTGPRTAGLSNRRVGHFARRGPSGPA